jgi:hypothetical protein
MSRGDGRVYFRERGRARRYYGDFRDYADVGGSQEALIPPGTKRATMDPDGVGWEDGCSGSPG